MHKILRGLISPDLLPSLVRKIKNSEIVDDANVEGTFAYTCLETTNILLGMFTERASTEVGRRLVPTHSVCRLYPKGSSLKVHRDRNDVEWTITINLSQTDPWPFYIDGEPIILEPGDGCLLPGPDIDHWRLPFEGTEYLQMFLHYVEAAGPHSQKVFDGGIVKLREHAVNALDNFICGYYCDPDMCDRLLEFYEKSPVKVQGTFGKNLVDPMIKQCSEIYIFPPCDYTETYLREAALQYVQKYPWAANAGENWNVSSTIKIQHYKPGEGYHAWHTERSSATMPFATRHLVFMTYLNTVTDGGDTEFYHQRIKIRPEKGLTLIWPADWTFMHRGVISRTQDKYIITGWYNYITSESACTTSSELEQSPHPECSSSRCRAAGADDVRPQAAP